MGNRMITRVDDDVLVERMRLGDEAAREKLVLRHLPAVGWAARRYARSGAQRDDLIQEGSLALLQATRQFDPSKRVRFGTYAAWWIRGQMRHFIRRTRGLVRGGEVERASVRDVSLDAPVGDGITLGERLEQPEPSPVEQLLRQEEAERVNGTLARLRKRLGNLGWDVVQERWMRDEPATLEEVGRRWGVSRERARQVEIRAKALVGRQLAALEAAP
jgi:RNA polymerase primary sigma factor